jgi:hypothetical protein
MRALRVEFVLLAAYHHMKGCAVGQPRNSALKGGGMLSDQIMVPSLKKRWQLMRDDAKETLEVAFRNGITSPCIVPVHFCYTKIFLSLVIEFHHFRVGYATFVIALVGKRSFDALLQ